MDDSSSDDTSTTTATSQFNWSNLTPHPEFSLTLHVPRREYHYYKGWTIKEIKAAWPCSDTGYTKEDQANLSKDLQRFYAQPSRDDGADGDVVAVIEIYRSPKSGFPGRLNSPGCQGLVRAIRSNMLEDTADLDMNNAQPRCVVWACKEFGIPSPQFSFYVNHRDGANGMLERIMIESNVSKAKAKQLVIITLTDSKKLRTSSQYLKKLDAEAKEIQNALMSRHELQWILPFCKQENRAGSFMSHLYHFIECKLLMRVYHMLVHELDLAVAALVFDGMNIADKSKHGDQAILDRARAVCEEVAPGINMPWAWKDLDFVLESKDKKPLANADGSMKELRVPESYKPPAPKQASQEALDVVLDPETQPTYEEMVQEFSLGHDGTHGKVGCEYIEVDDDGKVELFDTAHFKAKHRHKVYFYLNDILDDDGNIKETVVEKAAFADKWMGDERMDPRYLKDKTKRYYWERFDMYPDASKCPDNVYNLWSGFAAEKMDGEYDEDARTGLLLILDHVAMLCDGNAAQYDFVLNILAHAIQYPNVKLGIMLCLVGKQGCGKSCVWEIIERLMGSRSCFTTSKPDKDVWGDNNGRMKDAFYVRITEADKKKFAGYVGEMRTIVTDSTIRVRSLYCTAANVKSYTRFFLDTNFVDSIPDEHGERRFFIIKCNEEKIGDDAYFEALRAAIADDRAIRALFDFLKTRKIKSMYLGKDIPVGKYQKELKDSRRSVADQFLEAFVQDQPIMVGMESGAGVEAPTVITLPIDDVCQKFRMWQQAGSEFERSKSSITRELALSAIAGIKKIKPWEEVSIANEVEPGCGPTFRVEKKQVPKYVFDLVKLRERFGIGAEDAPPVSHPGATIDCDADIRSWEERVEEAQLEAAVVAAELQQEEARRAQEAGAEVEAAMENNDEEDYDYEEESEMEEVEAEELLEQGSITGQKRPRE